MKGIDDISNGRCKAGVVIKGEHHRCDLAAEHDGWAHSSREAETIWKG